jgi:ATP-dependent helicase/nuclease subunit A
MNPAVHPQSDESARERIRTSLDESLIVEASAGTGKTTELVKRIVAVLGQGKTTIDKIAAVTFTHKAAGELKLRLREELDKERHKAPLLDNALQRLEEASIGTIHSFCAQILRERPVEARVDPAFEELSEQASHRLYQRSFRAWLEKGLAKSSPGLRRAFARLARRDSWDDSMPIEQLQWAGRKLVEWRDYPAPWSREPFARDEEIKTLVRMVRELAEMSAKPRRVTDYLYRSIAPARALAGWIEKAESAGARDYDALEGLLLKLGRDLGRNFRKGSGEYGGGAGREDLVLRCDELRRWIEEFRRRADADLAVELREEMRSLVDEYNDRKQRAGKLDFVDLLIAVRDLVRDDAEVRHYLQDRFTHLFIDEFQDTDPLQAEILLLLASDDRHETDWRRVIPKSGKLFLVGDPKQSIYKFRRADIILYRKVRDTLIDRGVGFAKLTRSFRSVRNIQQLVNAAFETEMTGDVDSGQADWAPLEEHRPDVEGRPSVIVLPVPRPYKSRLAKEAVNKCLPDAIAAFIAWLVHESGWGFHARDIAVLFRRRTQGKVDLTREYARALEGRGLSHLLAGSKSFHRREEVETLRAGLAAIEWPDDELSVFATLKGSLFAIRDEVLLRYRHEAGGLHPFHINALDAPADEDFGAVKEALALLAGLHRARNRRPFAATVNALLEATRAHSGFVLRPGGNQILANVARVADLARTYEMSGGISFRGFVEELAAQAEKEDAAEAPVLEEDSDGVRLMTVHGAKGLEFPVVILADLTANIAARDTDQYVDGERRLCAVRLLRCAPRELVDHEVQESAREQAEGVRVAYVAATRARDLLVIPAVGDGPFPDGGWLSPLRKAIYPSINAWRKSQPARGCPQFGSASVIERPPDYDREGEISVRPGLIRPELGQHEVVWWDPSKLALNVEGGLGLHQKEILAYDGGASLGAYREWQAARGRVIEQGSRPEHEVFIATQALDAPPDPIVVQIAAVAKPERKAAGRRYGTLVHNVMRDVPLDADRAAIEQFVDWNTRLLGSPVEEREAAIAAVESALASPLLGRAKAAARCHREYPLVLNLNGGRVLEGFIDLAFVEHGQWVIVDFKTDADASLERRAQYERQLQWYAFALMQITNMPARAWLLEI